MPNREERFKKMIDSSQDWFWEFDEHANFTYVSPAIKNLLGYDPEELIGANAFDLMEAEEAQRVRKHFDPIAKNYLPFNNLINVNLHKDGHEVIIESSGTPLFDDEGTFCGYFGIDRDITERIQAEKKLRSSEEKFRTLTELAQVGIFLDDPQGNAIYVNPRCAEIVGVSVDKALNLDWAQYLHPDDRDRVVNEWLKAVENKSSFKQEYRYVHSDGQVVWTRGEATPVRNSQGKVSVFIGTMVDITELKQAEINLFKAQEQLLLREKMASLGRLAAGMAHEINNPLATILQSLQVIDQRINPAFPRNQRIAEEEGLDMDVLTAYLERQSINQLRTAIKESGAKAAAIVKKMLDYKNQNYQPAVPVDLRDVLEQAVKTLKYDLKLNSTTDSLPFKIENEIIDEPLRLFCAPLELHQSLVSIMTNSVEAMSKAGSNPSASNCLWLKLGQENDQIFLEIKDNGSGMSEEVREKLFEPFFTTKEIGSGAGLSMCMVYRFVQAANGTIEVDSALDQGCRIIMRFPRQRDSS